MTIDIYNSKWHVYSFTSPDFCTFLVISPYTSPSHIASHAASSAAWISQTLTSGSRRSLDGYANSPITNHEKQYYIRQQRIYLFQHHDSQYEHKLTHTTEICPLVWTIIVSYLPDKFVHNLHSWKYPEQMILILHIPQSRLWPTINIEAGYTRTIDVSSLTKLWYTLQFSTYMHKSGPYKAKFLKEFIRLYNLWKDIVGTPNFLDRLPMISIVYSNIQGNVPFRTNGELLMSLWTIH